MADPKNRSEKYWEDKLTKKQFKVLRKKATEKPFSGKYLKHKKKGVYRCAACDNPLFDSSTKFESDSGWPSFWDVIEEGNVDLKEDKSYGMNRTEVVCAKCGGHLGHVFDDGPEETPDGEEATGKRYCINSAALKFKKK